MALISKASLLMVPSTYEPGTLYNVLPSGNRAPDNKGGAGYDQTRADFDFDRGSNTAATRVNSDGLIEKYRENLLLQSNKFDTSWATINASLTSGQSGYDGSNDAWLLTSTPSNFSRIEQVNSTTGVSTLSVYAKAGTADWIMLRLTGSGFNDQQYFDIANGSVGINRGCIATDIEDVGNGWYRCTATTDGPTMGYVIMYPALGDGNLSTTNENIYIQNAQLESGLVATDYLESTSVTGKAGVLVDLPRINYDANGENGALLLEPSRANVVPFSEYLSGWNTIGSATFTTNHGESPEGVNNAMRFQATSSARGGKYYAISVSSGTSYTISVYVKSLTGTQKIRIGADNGCSTPQGAETFEVTENWKRIDTTISSTQTSWNVFFDNVESGTACTGTYLDTDILVYGLQAEAGSYPSSYIPNHLGTGGVTRAADSCSVTGVSDVIGQSEGTIFWEGIAQPNANPILVQLIPSAAGNYTNTIYLEYVHSTTNFKAKAYDTGTIQASISTGNVVAGQVYKLAFAYKANDFALYMNGTQIGTDTSGSIQSGLDKIGVGSLNGTTAAAFYGSEAKQVALFKERLTNAELATLTTL
jgi:hypothetical protein